ncbi:ATP synthase F1 subunit gamma [Parabacteroides sp. OttesenSCG-928-G07]|nr:ATP synthase F1 subunit gamma [Parabacteroides sp. OttesenSCG-928-G21]MDL2277982.1 ATP synthase F1 subunit gamma [Parabacteroides sp. OttesenSCG-928-G07]
MASLKEVKRRITSVSSTRKITQARQMVSSAKLHRSQNILEKAFVYKQTLDSMLRGLALIDDNYTSPYLQKQQTDTIAIIIMASNSGMIGSFNAKMEKELTGLKTLYPGKKLLFYPIGKKIRDIVIQHGFEVEEELDHLAEKVTFEQTRLFTQQVMNLFLARKVGQVEMIYYHFKTISTQHITHKTLLPYIPLSDTSNQTDKIKEDFSSDYQEDYILEPSSKELTETLIEMSIHAEFYSALIDNQTSEHATRTIAMQIASENANDILDELQITLNKLRQNNITNDLLDINSSSFA